MRFIYRTILIIVLGIVPALSAAQETILVLGDSLSAAFGIPKQHGWVNLLQRRLHEQRYDYRVANGSISGETTAGGLARLTPMLNHFKPSIVIVELGVNDGLRGLSLKVMQENLTKIIRRVRRHHAKVLLVGMQLPPNYGLAYTSLFHSRYRKLSEQLGLPLVPFLMQGLNNDSTHFQTDDLHPTAAAQPIILENIWQKLVPLLNK
ncbi:Arylesterase precursor [hydrothermal vent metagenome]|uniref:Arylesterase n=1 Tax=hydrothermal vent metagenome TaxID=652676 RepID=A0A3B1AYH5_9ZZZZ